MTTTPAPREAGEKRVATQDDVERSLRRRVSDLENALTRADHENRRLREAETSAYERGKAEERKTMMNLLGYDEYGEGLTEQRPDGGYLNHDPYYDLTGAILDLERQKADQVCIDTIKRAQARFLAVARRARGGDDE